MDQCPASDKIPVWSVVFGTFTFVNMCVLGCEDAWHKARVRAGEASDEDKKHTPVYFVIQCFMWAWAIWGSVIVFDCDDCSDAFTPANSTTDARGCDSMMYNFAFVSLILIWSVCAFAILILLIYLLTLIDWSACGSCPRMCGSACGTSLGHCLDAYHRVFGSGNKSYEEYKRSRLTNNAAAAGGDDTDVQYAAAVPSSASSAGSVA
jgi:hypothetical protein